MAKKGKDKNEFRVCSVLLWTYSMFPILGIALWIWLYSLDGWSVYFISFTVVNAMMILLFFVVLFWMFPKITIDESGVHRSLFKLFRKKHFTWDEIVCIKGKSILYYNWIYISDIDLKNIKLTTKIIFRHTIMIMNQEHFMQCLEKYCPPEKFIA